MFFLIPNFSFLIKKNFTFVTLRNDIKKSHHTPYIKTRDYAIKRRYITPEW